MKHLVVIPSYNEAKTIETIVSEIFSLYSDISILVVDDSSPDGTADIVRNLQKKYSNLHLLVQEGKGGLAKAYINGFKWGIQNGFDLFTSCDADFSHHPKHISQFREKINEGFDVVCGSRYVNGGSTSEKNFYRNLISIGGNIWANLFLNTGIKDLTGGYNTYTKLAFEKIDLYSIEATGYVFQAEMKYRAKRKGLKLCEIPIDFKVRDIGESKMSKKIVIEALISTCMLRFKVK